MKARHEPDRNDALTRKRSSEIPRQDRAIAVVRDSLLRRHASPGRCSIPTRSSAAGTSAPSPSISPAVSSGQIKRLLINIRPRSSKTSLVAIAWPVWTWAQAQTRLSADRPRRAIPVRLIRRRKGAGGRGDIAPPDRLGMVPAALGRPKVQIAGIATTRSATTTTAGGARISTGVPESLGKGGAVKILDDPHQDHRGGERQHPRCRGAELQGKSGRPAPTARPRSADVMVMRRLGRRRSLAILDRPPRQHRPPLHTHMA